MAVFALGVARFLRRRLFCGWGGLLVLAASIPVAGVFPGVTLGQALDTPQVLVVPDSAAQRVDVLVDGELFTAYLYADTLSVLKSRCCIRCGRHPA